VKRIVVTGGSGALGRYVVRDLIRHGYEVLNLDRVAPAEWLSPFIEVDLAEYGATFAAIHGYDAVVHLGAEPRPDRDHVTGARRFRNNTLSTFNIFQAAAAQGMQRVVWASSDTTLGHPYTKVRPHYAPVDEAHPVQPQTGYALSKVMGEELARQMNRMYGLPIIGLRFSSIRFTGAEHYDNYAVIPSFWSDPFKRKMNLWGYVDARDAAQGVRLSLESDVKSAEVFNLGAPDTIMDRPTAELLETVFPGIPARPGMSEFEAVLSIDKARRVLGYEPVYSWRNLREELAAVP
jgi:nucleoside-diphosphate-sugar epimerase